MKVAITLACIAPLVLGAQTPKPPAPRAIAAADAKAGEILGAVSQARGLPDGRVLVNDAIGRRVLLFEKDLQTFTVVADTTPATGNAYSGRFGGLIPYRGDSTLFVDPQALTMMVIDPAGKLGRVMSVPRPNEAQALVAGNGGFPGFDGQGRLVYRAPPQLRMGGPGGPGGPGAGGGQRVEFRAEGGGGGARGPGGMPAGFRMPDFPDSNAVVRVEMATRKLDTLGFVKVPKTKLEMTTDTSGRMMVAPIVHPLPQVDDWAVLADGSVALIRGIDYHIDWTKADGSKASTERLPFEWRHLNDSAKAAFVDSAQVVMNKMREEAQRQMRDNPGQMPRAIQEGAAMVGAPMVTMRFEGRPGGAAMAEAPRGRNEAGPAGGMNFQMPPIKLVPPNELPDYAPPFNTGAARADMDGNVWVRTSIMVNGGPIYDVIDSNGKLVDRVSLPAGRVIAGFGKGGIVYMGVRETAGVRLEQARRNTTTLP